MLVVVTLTIGIWMLGLPTSCYQRKLGSNLPSYGQRELWDDEKCETKFNEWWCETSHHITVRSVRLYSMNGGVRVDITSRWEVWDYTQFMVVWDFTSHHNEKCETIFNEWWCESWHHITMRSVRLYSMNGGVRIFACKKHCDGRMIVVVLCCHARREMQVRNLTLQNAL